MDSPSLPVEQLTLADLGWSDFFASQIQDDETDLTPMRIATVHRARVTGLAPDATHWLTLPSGQRTTDYAVGDWVLCDAKSERIIRKLDRKSLLRRRTEASNRPQLISANVDHLFIVTSCNADFNLARLERYLALANEAGTKPVIVLTKADLTDDAPSYQSKAQGLQRGLEVVFLNATVPEAAEVVAPWTPRGQTLALVGSSGVGKSTLLNTLAGKIGQEAQATAEIREDDAKGRHTTTSRSLHRIEGGGWVIDTPGMRSLHMSEAAEGLEMLFSEITELAPLCKFNNCTHSHEPGCAVVAATLDGTLDPDRLVRWRKLHSENIVNTPLLRGAKGNKKLVKAVKTTPKPPKPVKRRR